MTATPASYGRGFAAYYNAHWRAFAEQSAPPLLAWYAATAPGQARQPVRDVACGTGQLARHFLAAGYAVTGLDLAPAMLAHAAANNAAAVAEGRARFVQGDAAAFTLDEKFGLVLSTFDALNHLPSFDALRGCFQSVRDVLAPGGVFVFDLNTRLGLEGWNSLNVYEEDDGTVLIQRRSFDGRSPRALTTLTGFVPAPDGHYERFDEAIYNSVFEMEAVRQALLETGWTAVHTATLADLEAPLAEPEAQSRVYFVARGAP